MAFTARCLSIAALCTILSIAVAIGLLSCATPSDEQAKDASDNGVELGGADVEWGDGDGLLLVVMEDDVIGSAAYYGTANVDGSEVTLTGIGADTGEDFFDVAVGDDGWPTMVAMGSMWIDYSYNGDGSLNFEITDDGDVVYSGFDLSTAKSFPQERAARVTKAHLLACVAGILESTTSMALSVKGEPSTGATTDHPLHACLQNDEMVSKLAQIYCTVTLIMNARMDQIEQERCPEYQLNPEMQKYCLNFVAKQRAATHKLALAIHKTILAVALTLYSEPACKKSDDSGDDSDGGTDNGGDDGGGGTNGGTPGSCDASGSLLVASAGPPQWDEWGCASDFTISALPGDRVVIAMHYLSPANQADYWKVLGVLPAAGLTLTQTNLDTREIAAIYQRADCASMYQSPGFDPKALGLKVLPIENNCKAAP